MDTDEKEILAGTAAAQGLTQITKPCSTFTQTSQLSTGPTIMIFSMKIMIVIII